LLVVLENGLVLVPFMLISQAALIKGTLATELGLGGAALAILRVVAIRRGYPLFNAPNRALVLGGILLAANVALPRIFRPLMEVEVADWRIANLIGWHGVLPLLTAGAWLLPKPERRGDLNPERPWLPLFNYALWILGSAVHLWCVQHICDLAFACAQLAATAWVAAWALRSRLGDCLASITPRWEKAGLWLTCAPPLLAFTESRLYVVLVALNVAVYLRLSWVGREITRGLVRQLALLSFALFLSGLPVEWGRQLWSGFGRPEAIVFAITFFLVAHALRS